MKYLLVIIALFLTACSSGGGGSNSPKVSDTIQSETPEPLTSMWYGDSRCASNTYLESRNCFGGRKLIDLDHIDTDYDVIIIHLGFNDMFVATPEQFGAHLAYLIQGVESKTWCILPTWANYNRPAWLVSEFRQAMIDACPNTVDPQIEGYDADRIHYTDENYQQIREAYKGIINTFRLSDL